MSERDVYYGTHIWFVPGEPKPKTKTWWVRAKGGSTIGLVAWFGRWRKYSFFPEGGTVWEQVCLREIADFCEARTREHKGSTVEGARGRTERTPRTDRTKTQARFLAALGMTEGAR